MPKFRLSTLLGVVTCCAIVVAMWAEFYWFGLWLAIPHLIAFASAAYLVRRNRKAAATYLALVYLAVWFVSARQGIAVTRNQLQAYINSSSKNYGPTLSQKEFATFREHGGPIPHRPWPFIGTGASPCPFIIAIEFGFVPDAGRGGREIYLWLPGKLTYLRSDRYFHRSG